MTQELLIPLFMIIALVYSSVGFGGGSSYIALMLLFNFSFESIPTIALCCNIVVVCSGAFHYIKNKQVNWSLILPFCISSIPMSLLGASLPLEKEALRMTLGCVLLLAAIKMLFFKAKDYDQNKSPRFYIALIVGSILGLVSGIVGIGGGIFLSPIMYTFRWGHPRFIASTCCLFILFNSCSGLIGQLIKSQSMAQFQNFLPLMIAVFIGGQAGAFLSSKRLSPKILEITTGILVLFVSLRVLMVG